MSSGSAFSNTPSASTSATSTSAEVLEAKADRVAMDAKQYRAAGKPASLFLSRYYEALSDSYRHEAARVRREAAPAQAPSI
jgi:hypothetical protein